MGIISHNKEFCDAVATEKWIMKAGNLRQEGSSEERGAGDADKSGNKEKEDVFDQFGNKVDMADAEKDAKQIKDNKKKKILSQDEVWELEDRIAVLKEKIGEKKCFAGLSGLPQAGGRFYLQRNAAHVL